MLAEMGIIMEGKVSIDTLQCLIDLHVHLDGSLSVNTVRHLADIQSIKLDVTDKELENMLKVPDDCSDLNEYLKRFDFPLQLLQTTEAITECVARVISEQHEMGIMYSEIRFAPQLHTQKGLTQMEVVQAAIKGLENASLDRHYHNLILCCMRGEGNHRENIETVELAKRFLNKGVVAVDLAGAEKLYPTEKYAYIFERARKLRVPFTIHAGEADGADSVRKAVEYGALRIGHGVRAVEDEEVVSLLKNKNITLELCPTSNLNTKVFDSIKDFPIRKFIDSGVKVTVNTDNVTVSNTTIKHEFNLLKDAFDLTNDEVMQLLYNSADASFASKDIKNILRNRILSEFRPNKLFIRENVEQIVVPDIVRDDLLSIIEEKLKKAGFYYRIAYRVKAADSMVNKLILKDYKRPGTENEDKKMQDLIGIRIMLYFADDVDICRNLLDGLFASPGEWETTETNEYEFKAMKINGIFKLPAYLSKTIVNPMLSDYVDDTFEVQVRTNSFEGWHEIEHDLRYKGSAFGIGNEALARKMNSVLATYELCDDSIVGLLEDLGHQHYKDKKWDDMIRCHYRLKFDSEQLHPALKAVFDADTELAKKFYKFKRAAVIRQLWLNTSDRNTYLTVNTIIRIVNQLGPNNEKLKEAFVRIDNENSQSVELQGRRKRFEPFKELGKYKVFQARTFIDTDNHKPEDAFRKAAGYIYSWVKSRFDEAVEGIPDTVSSFTGGSIGYTVDVTYDKDNMYFRECTSHLDSKIAARIWVSTAEIKYVDNRLTFFVSNEYAEPKERYRDNENVLFSRPNFYGEIADNIGIYDVIKMREAVQYVEETKHVETVKSLIQSEERNFPVIVFIAGDDEWIEKFDVNYFAYLVGFYAHIIKIDKPEYAKAFAEKYELDREEYNNSITVFYPGKEPETIYKDNILHTTFEVIKVEKKKYWNENGCRAYRRQLVSQIRENNVL